MANLILKNIYIYPWNLGCNLKVSNFFPSALPFSFVDEESCSCFFFFPFFLCVSEVEKAIAALNGRFFGGRVLTAEKYDPEMFHANDLSGWEEGCRNVCESLWWEEWNWNNRCRMGCIVNSVSGGDLNCTSQFFFVLWRIFQWKLVQFPSIEDGYNCSRYFRPTVRVDPSPCQWLLASGVLELCEGCVWMRIDVFLIVPDVLSWISWKRNRWICTSLVEFSFGGVCMCADLKRVC